MNTRTVGEIWLLARYNSHHTTALIRI